MSIIEEEREKWKREQGDKARRKLEEAKSKASAEFQAEEAEIKMERHKARVHIYDAVIQAFSKNEAKNIKSGGIRQIPYVSNPVELVRLSDWQLFSADGCLYVCADANEGLFVRVEKSNTNYANQE